MQNLTRFLDFVFPFFFCFCGCVQKKFLETLRNMWESEPTSRHDYSSLLRRRQLGIVPAYRLLLPLASSSLLPRLSISLPCVQVVSISSSYHVQLVCISMLAPIYALFLASACSRLHARVCMLAWIRKHHADTPPKASCRHSSCRHSSSKASCRHSSSDASQGASIHSSR